MPHDRAVPIDWCVGGRELTEPRLSPDGRSIGFVVSRDGDARVVVRSLDGGAAGTHLVSPHVGVRAGRGLGGGAWAWAPAGDAIVHAGVDGELWWQPVDGGAARRLTRHGPARAAQAPCIAADGRTVAYVVDQCEVWVARIGSRAVRRRRIDDGSADFCFDPVVDPAARTVAWHAWEIPNMPWDRSRIERAPCSGGPVARAVEGIGAAQQPRFAPTGELLCVRDDSGWLNVWGSEGPLVDEAVEHAGPSWGLGQRSFAVDPTGRRIALTRNERGFGRLCVADRVTGEVVEVGRGVHGQLSWARVGDLDRIAAVRSGARTPTELVVYDLRPGSIERRVVETAPEVEWDRELLVEPELVEVPVDGEIVHARLFRADDAPEAPRMICWLHGGPTDQWQVTFMPRIAYWRAQGWHVLVPDHRGSTGHGRAYQQALNGRWGELDVADTAAAVRHVQAATGVPSGRTVLMGGSAGGFTVLGVLARHPGLAAAAVVSYPVSDLADLAERSHRFERHSTWTLVGAPGVDDRYRERSPVHLAPRISTPLLLFHGDADPVVPVEQSIVLAERIRAAGGEVELCIRAGEGHGFRRREHQVDEYVRTGEFLLRHVR